MGYLSDKLAFCLALLFVLLPLLLFAPLGLRVRRGVDACTLLRRLWAANSLDLLLDFALTYISVTFNYLSPFFLKRILDSLDSQDRSNVNKAYVYAFLAMLTSCS